VPEPGKLVAQFPEGEKKEFALSKGEVSIGRACTCDIVLRDPKISRAHTRIETTPEGNYVVDLGSANGTKLNGKRVQRALLRPGDVLVVGDCSLRYEAAREESDDIDRTRIDTEADLDATLLNSSLPAELSETRTPRLAIHTAAKTWELPLDRDVVTIGRRFDNDVAIESPRMSRMHARIERRGNDFLLRDLNSINGTSVGGRKIHEHWLKDGESIEIGGARMVFKAGYVEEDLTLLDAPGKPNRGRHPVIVIPGFLGSNLWLGSEKVWPNARNLIRRADILAYREDSKLEARGLVDEVVIIPNFIKQEQYGSLIYYLEEALGYERGKDLLEFAYDFRQDVRISARQLAQAVEDWGVAEPVTIVAHSMGSLVSRYYVDRLGGHKRVERLALLGGPHLGAPRAVGQLGNKADLFPFGIMGDKLRAILMTFPSVYQLLPEYPCSTDQHGNEINWLSEINWLPESCTPHLKAAAEFRAEMRGRNTVPTVCIFGYGLKTATAVRAQRDANGKLSGIEECYEKSGDGVVPELSATIQGADVHPIRQYHGTLHGDNDVKKRLKVELTR
jgi:pSer/pThr/pTyr-binding forkhead associated (FHA) protein